MTGALDVFRSNGSYEVSGREALACAALGGVLAAVLLFHLPAVAAFASGYLVFTMLLVVLIDYRHFIIPNALSLPAIPLGLLAAQSAFGLSLRETAFDHGLAALVAGGTFYAVRWIYWQLRGIEGLGLGDVKLAAAAGAWVGLGSLGATCLLATTAALAMVLVDRMRVPDQANVLAKALPFGSFIAPAIAVVWFANLFHLWG